MRIRWLAAVVLIVVGVGAVGLVVFQPSFGNAASTQYITQQVRQTNVVKTAAATGTVAATAEYGLAFGSAPQIVSSTSSNSSGSGGSGGGGSGTWLVKSVDVTVGKSVKAGDVLAVADSTDATNQLAAAQASLAAAQAKLAADEAGGTAAQKASARNQVTQAEQQLATTKQSVADSKAQNSLTLSQADKAVTSAKSQLSTDKANGAPQQQLDADQAAVTQAENSLASTKLRMTASNHQLDAQLTSAENAVTQAEQSYKTQTAPADDATLAADKASVATAQANVDSAQATLDAATLKAPSDGVVTAVNATPGFDAPSGYAVVLQSTGMEVLAQFTENDLPSLAVGQTADVTINATGQQTTATVSSVDPVASSSGGSSVPTYAVDLALDSVPSGTAAGMTAQITVTTQSADNVLAVPPAAINGTTGSYSVEVMDGNGAVTSVPVQVGLIGSTLVQITGGVTAGQAVVVGTTAARTGGSTTSGFGGLGGGVRGLSGGGGFPGGFQRGGGG